MMHTCTIGPVDVTHFFKWIRQLLQDSFFIEQLSSVSMVVVLVHSLFQFLW